MSTCPILYIIKILLYSITLDAVILTILVLRPFLYFSSCSLHRCQTFSSHVVNVRLYRRSIIYRFFCCHFHICISEVKPIYQHPIKVGSAGAQMLHSLQLDCSPNIALTPSSKAHGPNCSEWFSCCSFTLHWVDSQLSLVLRPAHLYLEDQSQESGSQTTWIFVPYYATFIELAITCHLIDLMGTTT